MKIEAIALQLPSRRVSNEDLLDEIRLANAGEDAATVSAYVRQVHLLLSHAGARIRYYRDMQRGESAIELIVRAAEEACLRAQMQLHDVDLLIYCGVGRGFAEPSAAAFVMQAMGLHCHGFDILDACMGWVRALHVAQSFILGGAYSTVLIVSGEFNVYEYGYPELLHVEPLDQLRHSFPSFTIGEAAAATVVTAAGPPWSFNFRARSDKAHLCSLPLAGYSQFARRDEHIARSGRNRLTAFGAELADIGLGELEQLFLETVPDIQSVDWIFPHVPGISWCKKAAIDLALGNRLVYDSFRDYGNLVSASLPAAMSRMISDSRLKRGHRVVLCPASAGMSFATVQFVY